MRPSMEGLKIPFLFSSVFSILIISYAVDSITKTQFITDGKTIVSFGGSFELGFFSPGESKNRYVGIWYKKISTRTVVWVANREIPLTDKSGALKVIDPGFLVLLNDTNNIIWSTNTSRSAQNPIVQLLDSGNLVVKDASDDNPENFLWQSFDHPCDTLLPGMKLGKNLITGLERHLSSWKSSDDPARGGYTYRCDPQGYPQNILSKGSIDLYRTGPWNGLGFSGIQNLKPNSIYTYGVVVTNEEVYFAYQLINSSIISKFALNQNGIVQRWTWSDRTQEWNLFLAAPTDSCDGYKLCGPYGSCNIGNFPVCSCLSKFVPKYPKDWGNGDWSNGCIRRTPLDCQNGDGFVKYSGYKLPDTRYSWFNRSMTLRECKMICLKNCTCMAYSNLDVRGGGSGCLLWFHELIDMRVRSETGDDIYIRMSSSESDRQVGFSGKKREIVIVTLALLIGLLLLGLSLTFYLRKKKKKNSQVKRGGI